MTLEPGVIGCPSIGGVHGHLLSLPDLDDTERYMQQIDCEGRRWLFSRVDVGGLFHAGEKKIALAKALAHGSKEEQTDAKGGICKWKTLQRTLEPNGSYSLPRRTLPCEMSHNAAFACVRGELIAIGGDLNEQGLLFAQHMPHAGRWAVRRGRVISGLANESGCVDQRPFILPRGTCQYDGKLSLVQFGEQWLLFARANPFSTGGRHVSVAASTDATSAQWSRFRPVELEGHPSNVESNVYFFSVAAAHRSWLFALYPGAAVPGGKQPRHCGVFASTSSDGVRWRAPRKLLDSPCSRSAQRMLHHPVDGLLPAVTGNGMDLLITYNVAGVLVLSDNASLHVCRYTIDAESRLFEHQPGQTAGPHAHGGYFGASHQSHFP